MASGVRRAMGIEFAHPIGVAAGYDRDGSRLAEIAAAGFAFVEVGTVNVTSERGATDTLQPVVENLARHRSRSSPRSDAVIGVSIGSLREPLDRIAAADIAFGAHALAPLADFLVVNLSRPGSASRDGRADARSLRALLERTREQLDAPGRADSRRTPLLVKVIALPGDAVTVPEAARLAHALGYDGMVIAFERWPSSEAVCGRIAAMRARLGRMSLVAVGGVRTANTARRYLRAGADLVEVYTAVAEFGLATAATHR